MDLQTKISKFFEKFHALEISWQIYCMLVIYFTTLIISYIMNWRIGILWTVFFLIMIIFIIFNTKSFVRDINVIANEISQAANTAEQDALYQAPLAILIYDDQQRIRWVNPLFQQLFKNQTILGESMESLNYGFDHLLAVPDDQEWHTVKFMKRSFRVLHQEEMQSFYLFDVTEEEKIIKSREYDQLVYGYLFLDDYNEIIDAMSDEQVARFDSDLLNDLNQWATTNGIYTKRLDEEKIILLMNNHSLMKLEENKFQFFDELHEKNYSKNVPISISLGVAYADTAKYSIKDLEEQAQYNLDLALGRGGDQIVVKSENGQARFYGGKSNPTEKRSNIRSRLVYQALKAQIQQADNVLVTGHTHPDTDSIGAAIGIHKIATFAGKEARIIINPDHFNHDIQSLLALPIAPEWDGIMVSHEQAREFVNDNTLIIMVDHSKPTLSEAQEFLSDHNIVVIDHHRRGEEFPNHTALSYIEIYASSASELVTEFYINMRNTKQTLNKFEATALLSGIIVDTNNFSNRTGSRTFDAASYLRSRGADITQIHSILKEDYQSIRLRNQILDTMTFMDGGYAIALAPNDQVIDNIIAAQAADMMLEIIGVEASFVIYQRDEQVVGISARSLNKINVQLIMERLGGGGHYSNAATQLPDVTITEAQQLLAEEINATQEE